MEKGKTNDHWERQTQLCNLGTVPYKKVFDLYRDHDEVLEYIGASAGDVEEVQSAFTSVHKRNYDTIKDAFRVLYEVEEGATTSRLVEKVERIYADDIAFASINGIIYTFENALQH